MSKNNITLRTGMAQYGFKQYECAEIIGYSEFAFCKMLRQELPEEFQQKVVDYLSKIRTGEKCDDSFIKEFRDRRRYEAYLKTINSTADYVSKKERIAKNTNRFLDQIQEERIIERGIL